MPDSPTISFIVPAYNEEALIARTIRSIHNAVKISGEPYEIIVADDASDDGTGDMARGCGAVVVREHHRQIAATRNSGARAARGELLIFVDGDTCINETVVAQTLAAHRKGAVGGGARVAFDGNLPWWARLFFMPMAWVYFILGIAAGCYIYCRRDVFEQVGGFSEEMFAGEEVDLTYRLRALKQGRFVIVRGRVVSSGRKVRAYSFWEIAALIFRGGFGGRKFVGSREGLDLWYGDRRADPDENAGG